MTVQLGTVVLPDDLQWIDEFGWLPTAQQVEIAADGALIIEESAQLAGRPITLEGRMDGNTGFALVTRATVAALRALAAAPVAAPLVLQLEDGRVFDVRFRHGDGVAVEAKPMKHVAPHEDTDLYSLTLRLMQV